MDRDKILALAREAGIGDGGMKSHIDWGERMREFRPENGRDNEKLDRVGVRSIPTKSNCAIASVSRWQRRSLLWVSS